MIISYALEHRGRNGAGHAGKGHDIHDPRCSTIDIVDRLAYGQHRLTLKGVVNVRQGCPEGLVNARLMQAPKIPVKSAQEPLLVLMLDMSCDVCLQQFSPGTVHQGRHLCRSVDVQKPFGNGRDPCFSSEFFYLSHYILVAEPV